MIFFVNYCFNIRYMYYAQTTCIKPTTAGWSGPFSITKCSPETYLHKPRV